VSTTSLATSNPIDSLQLGKPEAAEHVKVVTE
jgi:hypothetical protein